MGYWQAGPPLIWLDPELDLFGEQRFRVVDGGAAGDLFEPFDSVAGSCLVYTFEPRGAETIEQERHVNIDAGLWSEPCTRTLHVAEGPKASSIYPPDIAYLERFPDRVGAAKRRTASTAEVPLTSIDAEVGAGRIDPPEFIKLDIHSAEYEALLGCRRSLDRCLGLLVETWHAPVHAGQHLHGEVEALLASHGFRLFDLRPASAWRHVVGGRQEQSDRRQLVGSEGLFLREDPPPGTLPRYVALLELFGYSNLAVLTCDRAIAEGAQGAAAGRDVAAIRLKLIGNQKARRKALVAEADEQVREPAKSAGAHASTAPAPRRRFFGLRG